MDIVISSGHGKYVRGASGYLDEVDEARRVVDRVAEVLRAAGHTAHVFHDNTSTSQNENLNTIVDYHNGRERDLDVSVHFNAYETTPKPMGCECLYVTQEDLADRVSNAIADAGGFLDRGPKYRSDLFFLNSTEEPAILIETTTSPVMSIWSTTALTHLVLPETSWPLMMTETSPSTAPTMSTRFCSLSSGGSTGGGTSIGGTSPSSSPTMAPAISLQMLSKLAW